MAYLSVHKDDRTEVIFFAVSREFFDTLPGKEGKAVKNIGALKELRFDERTIKFWCEEPPTNHGDVESP